MGWACLVFDGYLLWYAGGDRAPPPPPLPVYLPVFLGVLYTEKTHGSRILKLLNHVTAIAKNDMSWNENIIIYNGIAHKPSKFLVVFSTCPASETVFTKEWDGGWGEGESAVSYFLHIGLRINMLIFLLSMRRKVIALCSVHIFYYFISLNKHIIIPKEKYYTWVYFQVLTNVHFVLPCSGS